MPAGYSTSRSFAMTAGAIVVIVGFFWGIDLRIIIPGVALIAWGAFC